jgi:hypothetical protein
LIATIRPAASARCVAASASSVPSTRVPPARNVSRGPQSGQAMGWAWKRRSAGSAYSTAQAAHIGKPAIVVDGRS